jgi:hypothetical protein
MNIDMKVFMCRRQGGYSGGLAVVAANSKEEAFKTFFEDKENDWMVSKWTHTDEYTEEYTDDSTKWHSDYYPLDKWFECKKLTANVDKPCVIMEDGHTE